MWDGDKELKREFKKYNVGSKPTVWDGDMVDEVELGSDGEVLSPPCGMETF